MSSEAIPAKEHPFALLRRFQLCHMDVFRKTAYVLLFMLAGFALARTQLILQMSPFGPAFVAACFFSRRSESLFAAAAVCIGALLVPQNTLFVVTVTLLLCAALIAVGQNRQKRWVVLMSMACAYIVGAAVFKTASLATYLPALIECLVSMVIFYVLSTLIDIGARGSRRSLFFGRGDNLSGTGRTGACLHAGADQYLGRLYCVYRRAADGALCGICGRHSAGRGRWACAGAGAVSERFGGGCRDRHDWACRHARRHNTKTRQAAAQPALFLPICCLSRHSILCPYGI